MFTGIINGQGKILAIEPRGHETRFTIGALYDLADIVGGESIAVNGTCLTVETFGNRRFSAYASAETLQRTTLGGLKTGDLVNLERALPSATVWVATSWPGTSTAWPACFPSGRKANLGASASAFRSVSGRKSLRKVPWPLTA